MNTGGLRPRPLRPIGKLLAEDTRRHHRSLILQHLFAAGLVATVPVIILFAIIERRVVGGLTAGGVK